MRNCNFHFLHCIGRHQAILYKSVRPMRPSDQLRRRQCFFETFFFIVLFAILGEGGGPLLSHPPVYLLGIFKSPEIDLGTIELDTSDPENFPICLSIKEFLKRYVMWLGSIETHFGTQARVPDRGSVSVASDELQIGFRGPQRYIRRVSDRLRMTVSGLGKHIFYDRGA